MRPIINQPQAERPGVPDSVTEASGPAAATAKNERPRLQLPIGYDGAVGRTQAALGVRPVGKAHSPASLGRAEADRLALQVDKGATSDERLGALHELANLAAHQPKAVREALRYDVGTPYHTIAEYEVELAKSLGVEGARLYVENLHALASTLRAGGNPKVCLINATFSGGGVAEMFQTQGHIVQQLGIDVEWHKTWDHDGDYGEIGRKAFDAFQGGATLIKAEEHGRWAAHNTLLASIYRDVFSDSKVGAVFLEDHHAIHFIPEIKKHNPDMRIIWRSHVDMAGVLDGKQAATDLWQKAILPNLRLLGPNDAVFFQPGSVPQGYNLPCSVFVCPPGIDPLSPKNQRLDWDCAQAILKKEVPDIDLDLKYLVTGGRFVAWKGNIIVQRAFLSIAEQYPEIGLFVFAGIGKGDDRKIAQRDLFDASLAEFPEAAKRVRRMDDRSSVEIAAAYALAAHSELPYVAASCREGYGMVGDEAARQRAAVLTFLQGGFSRYGEEPDTAAFSVSIANLVDTIDDPTQMYRLVDGKVVASPEAQAIQDLLAAKLKEIFDARRHDPGYSARYQRAAEVAERITLEHSSPVMARNYLAAVAATPAQLARASERVKSQGAAHVASVADVIGEDMYGS